VEGGRIASATIGHMFGQGMMCTATMRHQNPIMYVLTTLKLTSDLAPGRMRRVHNLAIYLYPFEIAFPDPPRAKPFAPATFMTV